MALDLTGIENVEFYSGHYLDAVLEGDLQDLFKGWREDKARTGRPEPFDALGPTWNEFEKAVRAAAGEPDAAQRFQAARGFHARLVEALGYTYAPDTIALEDGKEVPLVARVDRSGRPFLWIVDAPFSEAPDRIDPLDTPPLIEQYPGRDAVDELRTVPESSDNRGERATWRELLDGALFQLDPAPRWILFLGGDRIVLAERHKWPMGRLLRFDLGALAARREKNALRAFCALLHRDALAPDDGTCLHDGLEEKSHKHAFAVSGDLKFGVRRAVELLANEAVEYRRTKQKKGVFDDPKLAEKLKDDCLTYMYRLLFLLYVEARGAELGVVPMRSDAYRDGYSLESLRDLELVPLTTEESRNGFYIDKSLKRLFHIVNEGFLGRADERHLYSGTEQEVMSIAPLRAPLFDDGRFKVLGGVSFRNHVLQEVIRLLSLSAGGKGGCGRISYAQLGISQLGSVYESLLSYTGFFASEGEGLYEVAAKKDAAAISDANRAGGDAGRGSREELPVYYVRASEIDRYADDEFVRDQHGERVRHEKGTFIYALAGRSREKSASFYTPEVLTECVVKYALKELLLDEDGAPKVTADEILGLTVCEPAMGSGAFLIEAIDQLADAYLERRQAELGQPLPSDRYQAEKRRVKARLATNNCYGVDLNPVAVELAQVSLWLGAMAEGTKCPWFGLRLAAGNSLVGARREVFHTADVTRKGSKDEPNWLGLVPEPVPMMHEAGAGAPSVLAREWRVPKRPEHTIYHFLLPDAGMAAFDKDKVVKDLAPNEARAIAAWRKEFTKPFSKGDAKRLEDLSDRVDLLWAEVVRERALAASETTDRIPVWGEGGSPGDESLGEPESDGVRVKPLPRVDDDIEVRDQERVAAALEDESSAYRRLRLAMDAWCALWFWPIERAHELPSRAEWLAALELVMLGEARVPEHRYQGFLFGDLDPQGVLPYASAARDPRTQLVAEGAGASGASATATATAVEEAPPPPSRIRRLKDLSARFTESRRAAADQCGLANVAEIVRESGWLQVVEEVRERQRFHHWQLRFAEVFGERGGFDLIVGNPPWIKLQWNEAGLLSEFDPTVAIRKTSATAVARRRSQLLDRPDRIGEFLADLSQTQGAQTFLNASGNYALLKGQQTNLYKCFVLRGWENSSLGGVAGFVHPEGIYDDPKGGVLRRSAYPRLRAHFQFVNEFRLFSEVSNHVNYSLNVWGPPVSHPAFLQASNLFHPITITQSLAHDGHGQVPGIKDTAGHFSTKAHRSRVLTISEELLALFARLYDEPGTHPHEARLPVVHSTEIVEVLRRFAEQPRKLGDLKGEYFATVMFDETYAQRDGTIKAKSHEPSSPSEWIIQGPHFYVGTPFNKTPNTPCTSNRDYKSIDLTSIPDDFLPRTNYVPACPPAEYTHRTPKWRGKPVTDYYRHVNRRQLPATGERTLISTLMPPGPGHVHTCVSASFASVLDLIAFEAFCFSIPLDFFLKSSGRGDLTTGTLAKLPFPLAPKELGVAQALRVLALVSSTPTWGPLCREAMAALRCGPQGEAELAQLRSAAATDLGRRRLLVELDVLASMALQLTFDDLCLIYRVQFPVLQEYERANRYDLNGRLVPTSATANGRDAVSLQKLAALLESEAAFDQHREYEPGSAESNELLARSVKLPKKDAAVLGVPERCRLDQLFAETEVTYYPGDGTTSVKKTLLGIRYTDPGLYPEQPRTYPTPWTAHDREADYRTVWAALESLDAQRIPAHPLPQGEHVSLLPDA